MVMLQDSPGVLGQHSQVRVGAVRCESSVVVQQQTQRAPARLPEISPHHPGDVRHLQALHDAAGDIPGRRAGQVLDLSEERVHPVEEIVLPLSGPQGRHPHLGLSHRHGEGAGGGEVTESLSGL